MFRNTCKNKPNVLIVIYYICFLAIWAIIGVFADIAVDHGVFSVFYDLYGKGIIWIGIALAITIVLSPLYLRIFIKQEYVVAGLCLLLTIVFILVATGALNYSEKQFRNFTPELWSEYPNHRMIMVSDLVKNNDIIGMSKEQVVEILGEPDKTSEFGLSYKAGQSGHVFIYLKEGKVKRIDINDNNL